MALGIVTECKFLPKSGGRIGIEYQYCVNSKIFNNSSTRVGINTRSCNDNFVGKKFPVLYNPENNNWSTLLMTPLDFKAYNLSFPDSLKWVLEYIEK